MFDRPFVLLYTTAGRGKPSYQRGILDALCYPESHVIRYHYKLKEISSEVQKFAGMSNIPALIVFVDSRKTEKGANWEITYFPIRLCEIVRFPEIGKKLADSRIELHLKLGRFIPYQPDKQKDQWHARVAQFDSSRKIINDRPKYFAISSNNIFDEDGLGDTATEWEAVVRFLSESERLKNAIFMRVSPPQLRSKHFRRLREFFELPPVSTPPKPVAPFTEDSLTSYTVRPAKEYRIDITIYDSPVTTAGINKHSGLKIESSSDQVYLAQPFHTVVSGLLERSAILSFKRSTESLLTTLSFNVTDPTDDAITNSPILHLYITPYLALTILFLFLILFGTLLVSVDVEGLRFLVSASGDPFHLVYVVTKVAGSFILLTAAYIAYKILPRPSGKT